MRIGGGLAVILLLTTASCVRVPDGGKVSPGGCRGCFLDLPPSLTELPNASPEQRRLDRDLTFVDADGLVWKAAAGDITDGASIPEIFLPITGPRFQPDFLPAAIVHDRYTHKAHLVRPWRDAARMFHQAMLANGTPRWKAKLMFYAVYVFGPHWGTLSPGTYCGPKCINLTRQQSRYLKAAGPMARGEKAHFYFQPEAAATSDLSEITDMRDRIVIAEENGQPLSIGDLEIEAARRHPDHPFLARAP